MELLQYEPQTTQVHAVPLLFSPPWINKYYIMDLAPGRSFVEWAVSTATPCSRSATATPDPSMSDVTLDDYLLARPAAAIDVVQEITGADTVNIVGLCLGGTLTAIAAAYLAAAGRRPGSDSSRCSTRCSTSASPASLGVFTDERTVARLERQMAKRATSRANRWPARSTCCAPTT